MAGEWPTGRLREISELITKGTTPTTLGMSFVGNGVNYIKSESITPDGFIDRSKFAFIDQATHEALKRSQIKPYDLLFSMAGIYLGKTALVSPNLVPANTNQAVAIIRLDKGQADPQFVGYSLRNPRFNAYVNNLVGQSAQPNINLTEIGNLEIALPSIDEQRAIAHILGTLDDKIELNRRMNGTLEAMARAIFKSWFVDFDPVRAKASGEPPESICRRLHLTPDLLALFPDRFRDSELGEIPEEWEVKPLDNIANYLNGLALQKFPPESETDWLPVIKIAQLKKGDSTGADRASTNLKPEYIVDDGDVLFSWSGTLEVDVWCGGQGALNQHLFLGTSETYPKWFFLSWTKHHLPRFQAIAAGKTVTMGHIQRKHLTEALCVVPPLSGNRGAWCSHGTLA